MSYCRHLLLISIVILTCSFAAAKWTVFETKEGKFKVDFPAQPKQSTKTINTPVGPLQMNIVMFDGDLAEEGNKLYMVMYTDYPEAIISSSKKKNVIDTFFKNSIDGAVNNIHGSLISVENTTLGTYPGRIVKTSFSEGKGFMDMKMFLVKNRIYILEVGYQKGGLNNGSLQHFFKSFSLLAASPKK